MVIEMRIVVAGNVEIRSWLIPFSIPHVTVHSSGSTFCIFTAFILVSVQSCLTASFNQHSTSLTPPSAVSRRSLLAKSFFILRT